MDSGTEKEGAPFFGDGCRLQWMFGTNENGCLVPMPMLHTQQRQTELHTHQPWIITNAVCIVTVSAPGVYIHTWEPLPQELRCWFRLIDS